MERLNGDYYDEVKDKWYIIHSNENITLQERYPPKSLRNRYQGQNDTQFRENQKVVENIGRLEVKN